MKNNNDNNEECKLMLKTKNKAKYENKNERSIKILNNNKSINIIIFVFTLILIFLIIKLFGKHFKISINEFYDTERKIENNSFIINNTLIKELTNYIELCKNGTLLYGIQKCSQNPKITVIIPIYNAAKTIKTTIRSIQNQNMEDIEILLIDDFSEDNSIKIIEELQKEDTRIKLLKSKKNRGTLYTRSIGAFNSRGKYIMTIDHDNLFINNIFSICYKEAESNSIDIIEFSGYNIYSFNNDISINIPLYLRFKEDGLIVKQPELSSFMYKKINNSEYYELIDGLIWGKFILTNIYRKALDLLGDIIYNEKNNWSEDRIVNFALLRVANSFKFIKKDGIIHNKLEKYTDGNKMNSVKKNEIFYQEFIYVMSVFNLTKNTEEEILSFTAFKDAWKFNFYGLNEDNKKFAMNIYNDIMNCTNIPLNIKEELSILVKNKW